MSDVTNSTQWPKPPGPKGGFNNFEDAIEQAARWAAIENKRNRDHMSVTVIPYYIERGAREPFNLAGEYTRHEYRNQPFPVSAPKYEPSVVAMSEVPGSGTSGYQPVITPMVDGKGNVIPQFSKTKLLGMCQVEFEAQTGLSDHFTTRIPQKVLEAAGMAVVVPDVPLSEAFGIKLDDGMWSFAGNWQNSPADGTRATNPHDGKEYVFYSKGTSVPILKRLWLSPDEYREWRP